MFVGNICTLRNYSARTFAFTFLVAICVGSPGYLYGQSPNAGDLTVSPKVRELIRDTEVCLRTYDVECARASLNEFPTNELNGLELYRYRLLQGRVAFIEGDYQEAIDVFKEIADLATNPKARVDYQRYVAQLYASMGQFQQAYDILEEVMVEGGLVPLGRRHLTNDALWLGLDIYATGNWGLVELVPSPPEFPLEATERGLLSGYVDLEFTVTPTGTTRDVRVIESSHFAFEESAVNAAQRLRYKPRLVAGKPVETVISYHLEFQKEAAE